MAGDEKLLPCPFCGSVKVKFIGAHRPYWHVICESCGADGGTCHTKDEAHEFWNRRATPSDDSEWVRSGVLEQAVITVRSNAAPGRSEWYEGYKAGASAVAVEVYRMARDAAPTPAADDGVNERCQRVMRERGKPYPRTCYVCGLRGPCVTSDAQVAAIANEQGGMG